MNHLHRISALLTTAMLGAVLFTGCSNKGVNIAEEDLPYGATMRESKTAYAIPVSYDRRFVNEEQLTALTEYLAAIQNGDGEKYRENTLDFYADYQLNEVYSTQYKTMDEMVVALQGSVAEITADDFAFSMATIDGFTQERVVSGLNTMIEILSKIDENGDFMSNVDDCWALDMQWIIRYNGGSSSMIVDDQYVFMFEIDGKYYCVM